MRSTCRHSADTRKKFTWGVQPRARHQKRKQTEETCKTTVLCIPTARMVHLLKPDGLRGLHASPLFTAMTGGGDMLGALS